MSNINVGARAQNMDIGAEVPNITRVNLVVDSDHMYTAGNDTGRTMEVECPWGTQAMADSILATVSGVQYRPYTAERAMVDPAFEPGDAVSVGGLYSQIISADFTYNGAGLVNIGAPDLDEIDDEYPAQQSQSSSIKRQLAYTRSLITKTAEQIRLSVEGMEGQLAAMDISLDEITLVVAGLDSAVSSIEQTVDSIELSVSSEDGSTVFKITADGTTLSTKTVDLTVDAVNVSGTLKANNVEVEAAAIAGTLSAKALALDGALELTEDGEVYGYMGVNEVKGGPVMSDSTGNIGVIVTNNAAKISYKEDKMIWVANGGCYSSYTMQVYSDKRLKNSINYDLSKAEALFPLLKACSFQMNSDKDGKTNWGFISNEVIESATSVGLDAEKLALIGKSGGMNTLAYGQITALNTHMIQKLMARVDALEGKNNEVSQ